MGSISLSLAQLQCLVHGATEIQRLICFPSAASSHALPIALSLTVPAAQDMDHQAVMVQCSNWELNVWLERLRLVPQN